MKRDKITYLEPMEAWPGREYSPPQLGGSGRSTSMRPAANGLPAEAAAAVPAGAATV